MLVGRVAQPTALDRELSANSWIECLTTDQDVVRSSRESRDKRVEIRTVVDFFFFFLVALAAKDAKNA